ncbi:MAG: FkbM family methyltransferase [Bdellovibrionota bacterium]
MNDGKYILAWNKADPGTPAEVLIDHNAVKYPFVLRNHTSDVHTFEQIFMNHEYDFNVKSTPEIIIDAGANIGFASMYFSGKYPESKIIAIEPEKSNFQLLVKNVAPYKNIFPLQAALWNENGKISLVDPGEGHWGFMTDRKDNQERSLGAYQHEVRSITVDKIIREFKLAKIDILKIDIEGAEREVFADTSAWIDKVGSLIVELHDRLKPGCTASFQSGAKGFDNEWKQGENIYLSRDGYLIKP